MRTLSFIVLALTFLISVDAMAQIENARGTIGIGNQAASVSLSYRVTGKDGDMPFRIIRLRENRVENLEFKADGKPVNHKISKSGAVIDGLIDLQNLNVSQLQIAYNVRFTDPNNFEVPIVILDTNPPEAQENTFSIDIALPEGTQLEPLFPSNTWVLEEGTYNLTLSVIPSIIKAQILEKNGYSGLGFQAIDILVFTVIIGLSYLGWRRLQMQSQ